ncbi:MAG: EVE domain-containing protein [Bdellovibrionales bacterium]
MAEARYWLMKSEPGVFSIQDLAKKRKSLWDGVRNYQARNFMTQQMSPGDVVLFYHSSCEPPGVAGLAKVSGHAVPDPSQFDKKSEYYEPKATPSKPVWFCVEVEFVREFKKLLPLETIRKTPKLSDLPLLQKGQRLSIQPVSAKQFQLLLELAGEKKTP